MDLIYITKYLNTHEKCVKCLEKKRWNGVPVCPYCDSQKSSPKALRYTCLDCTNSYSVTVGTTFEDSNLPLYKWFMAIVLILSAKKGISSLQLSRDLSVNKNTAWLLQMKIRSAMQEDEFALLNGIVEADETFVGAKINGQFPPRKNYPKLAGGTDHLKPVFGMIQRKGRVITKVIDKPSREEIMPILKAHVTSSSVLVTDASHAYFPAKKYFKSHMVMSRGGKIFKRGIYHKNTIEGFWSQFKRAIIGQYHKIAEQHLQLYLDELSFKYNHRLSPDRGYHHLLKKLIRVGVANF
ncbi:IS1595 family transposase [Crocinitomix catalasitica]|nr:IS1595 family transposase [Crocinitomix catalasitica]